MKKRKEFHKKHADKKIKIMAWISIALLITLFLNVIRDSLVHALPFYYVLYAIAGIMVGRFVGLTQTIELLEDKKVFTIKVKPIGIIISILLLGLRYFAGRVILEGFNVVWAIDGVYLFFIGINYSKLHGIINRIDEHVYMYLFAKD